MTTGALSRWKELIRDRRIAEADSLASRFIPTEPGEYVWTWFVYGSGRFKSEKATVDYDINGTLRARFTGLVDEHCDAVAHFGGIFQKVESEASG